MIIGALEAGGTKMVVATGNESGKIFDKEIIPTQSPELTIPKIVSYFSSKKINALGLASFGPVDLDRASPTYGYITSTPKLAWQNFDFAGVLGSFLQVPIGFDTDVNGAALGEAEWGASRSVKNSVYITVGTGIGFGVIVNGKPLHGMMHPEAGHMFIPKHENDKNFAGVCPFHGSCLEGLASGPAIEARWHKKAEFLLDNDEVWDLEAFYIAEAIVNCIFSYSSQMIILGGGVMQHEGLLELVRANVKKMLNSYIVHKEIDNIDSYIVKPALNGNQGIAGCIKLATEAWEENN